MSIILLSDAARERAIELSKQQVLRATDARVARRHFREMVRLITGRTPGQVARMEKAKGLT